MRKIKKIIFAIDAAPAAIPVKPKRAAIIATTRKITVHLNIAIIFNEYYETTFVICLFTEE
jgi:hypothetical protein